MTEVPGGREGEEPAKITGRAGISNQKFGRRVREIALHNPSGSNHEFVTICNSPPLAKRN
jgi:hypothetical protein